MADDDERERLKRLARAELRGERIRDESGVLQVLVDHATGEQFVAGIDVRTAPRLLCGSKGLAQAFDVEPRTIRKWLKNGTIPPPLRLGRRMLWSVDRLRDWIAGGCLPVGQPNANTDTEANA